MTNWRPVFLSSDLYGRHQVKNSSFRPRSCNFEHWKSHNRLSTFSEPFWLSSEEALSMESKLHSLTLIRYLSLYLYMISFCCEVSWIIPCLIKTLLAASIFWAAFNWQYINHIIGLTAKIENIYQVHSNCLTKNLKFASDYH